MTAPARVVAQAVNYRSHAADSGFDPDAAPGGVLPQGFALHHRAGLYIIRHGSGFLDYEVELGLVIGADMPVGTTVTEENLARYVAALVVANDVSARQIQLVNTEIDQFEVLPHLHPRRTMADPGRRGRPDPAGLAAAHPVSERRGTEDNTTADMIVRPAQALTLLSRFQPMAPGDLLLTGTPGGTALKAPAKIACLVVGLLPATRWKLFFKRQAANPRYLHDGDVITATIASPDGRLNLGTQHNTVIGKTP